MYELRIVDRVHRRSQGCTCGEKCFVPNLQGKVVSALCISIQSKSLIPRQSESNFLK